MAKTRILTGLRLDKIAAVDRPCQEHATVAIIKRAGGAKIDADRIAKDLYGVMSSSGNPPGPRSFADLFAATEECRRQSEVSQELWPYFDALTDSIRSIVADTAMDEAGKVAAIATSIDQFKSAVTAAIPDAEAEMEKVFTDLAKSAVTYAGQSGDHVRNKENPMSDDAKKVADLEKSVADLTKRAEKAEADLAKANADLATANTKVTDLTKAADLAKNDEVLKVGETEVRKSAVGEASFAIFKAQAAEMQKARDDAENARLEKRADDEFSHVPGTTAERAGMLKAISKVADENVRKAFDAVFKQAEKLAGAAFETVGINKHEVAGSPEAELEKMADDLAKKDNISKAKAYDQVLQSDKGRELYAKRAQPQAQ
ncbi:hypothetical protein [Mesorhizobium sp.]|uniref:hypothetical protein n=1 Tax=Mesorhizobium sp. TaxID=1871066 RepID=UPI000FE4F925|nr:hypothetical protein [Mesorhizobium sp.]RWB66566.1 MAG: hypothetical protein EOQ49_28150 [Mesorhizobium sp.]